MTAAALAPPPGEPGAVFDAAARLVSLAGTASGAKGSFAATAARMVSSLSNPRAAEAAEAAGSVSKRLTAAAHQLALAGSTLQDYATVLAAAKESMADLATQWDAQQAAIQRVGADAPTTRAATRCSSTRPSGRGRSSARARRCCTS